jgi:hypothetical protein
MEKFKGYVWKLLWLILKYYPAGTEENHGLKLTEYRAGMLPTHFTTMFRSAVLIGIVKCLNIKVGLN